MDHEHLNTTAVSASTSGLSGLIKTELVQLITKIVVTLDVFLALAGIIANSFNIAVFWKIGLTESTNVTFFRLSLADLCVTFFMLFGITCRGLTFLPQDTTTWFKIDPNFLNIAMSNTGIACITSSILLTTFLAVQRCCCVVLPFKFKSMFTRRRAVIVTISIVMFNLIFLFGYTCLYGVRDTPIPGTNRSSLQVFRRPFRDRVLGNLTMVNIFCVKMPCQLIVCVCVIIMYGGLRRSLKFRQTSTSVGGTGSSAEDNGFSSTEKSGSLSSSSAEVQLIKSVIFVSTVFVFCNTPSVVIVIVDDFVPELSSFGRYRNVFFLIFVIRQFCEIFSSSFNFVIYVMVNRKFRETFSSLLKRK